MVRWYHAIVSAYGFWLPNDPRGSWSEFVHAWELFRFGGPATTVAGRRSYAHDPHDLRLRRETKAHLKYPPSRFDERCRASIARGFERACDDFSFVLHACAIGHDHVHVVAARDPARDIEGIVSVLKARATSAMTDDGTHPMLRFKGRDGRAPTPWGKSGWTIFINDEAQLASAVAYVERHPLKEAMARQHHPFVVPLFPRES